MFARDCSTRGQMKSPFIAQRGEGGVRGGSGELAPTAQGELEAQRDAEAQSMSSTVSGSGTSPIALRVRALWARSQSQNALTSGRDALRVPTTSQ